MSPIPLRTLAASVEKVQFAAMRRPGSLRRGSPGLAQTRAWQGETRMATSWHASPSLLDESAGQDSYSHRHAAPQPHVRLFAALRQRPRMRPMSAQNDQIAGNLTEIQLRFPGQ